MRCLNNILGRDIALIRTYLIALSFSYTIYVHIVYIPTQETYFFSNSLVIKLN